MSDSNSNTSTTKEVELSPAEIDAILGSPGSATIMLPTKEEEKQTVFSKEKEVDLTFLDKPEEELSEEEKLKKAELEKTTDVGKTILDKISADVEDENATDEEKAKKAAGRPKVDKSLFVEAATELIAQKILFPFDEETSLDKYTKEDVIELIKANLQKRDELAAEKVPGEFFDSLPEELKQAAAYAAQGGTDMKGLFLALAQVQETKELDVKTEAGQEQIALRYLQAKKFGTPEECQEEVNGWKDRGELEKKAGQFKPKLDEMSEEIVNARLKQQEKIRKQQEENSKKYIQSVTDVLKTSELGGIKLDKKTQGMLYSGLVEPAYHNLQGHPTNLLGHLLEKIQFVEPNHALLAKLLWLAADEAGYEAKILEKGGNAKAAEVARKLKTEADKKTTASSDTPDPEDEAERKRSTVKRPMRNIFSKV